MLEVSTFNLAFLDLASNNLTNISSDLCGDLELSAYKIYGVGKQNEVYALIVT